MDRVRATFRTRLCIDGLGMFCSELGVRDKGVLTGGGPGALRLDMPQWSDRVGTDGTFCPQAGRSSTLDLASCDGKPSQPSSVSSNLPRSMISAVSATCPSAGMPGTP